MNDSIHLHDHDIMTICRQKEMEQVRLFLFLTHDTESRNEQIKIPARNMKVTWREMRADSLHFTMFVAFLVGNLQAGKPTACRG